MLGISNTVIQAKVRLFSSLLFICRNLRVPLAVMTGLEGRPRLALEAAQPQLLQGRSPIQAVGTPPCAALTGPPVWSC